MVTCKQILFTEDLTLFFGVRTPTNKRQREERMFLQKLLLTWQGEARERRKALLWRVVYSRVLI